MVIDWIILALSIRFFFFFFVFLEVDCLPAGQGLELVDRPMQFRVGDTALTVGDESIFELVPSGEMQDVFFLRSFHDPSLYVCLAQGSEALLMHLAVNTRHCEWLVTKEPGNDSFTIKLWKNSILGFALTQKQTTLTHEPIPWRMVVQPVQTLIKRQISNHVTLEIPSGALSITEIRFFTPAGVAYTRSQFTLSSLSVLNTSFPLSHAVDGLNTTSYRSISTSTPQWVRFTFVSTTFVGISRVEILSQNSLQNLVIQYIRGTSAWSTTIISPVNATLIYFPANTTYVNGVVVRDPSNGIKYKTDAGVLYPFSSEANYVISGFTSFSDIHDSAMMQAPRGAPLPSPNINGMNRVYIYRSKTVKKNSEISELRLYGTGGVTLKHSNSTSPLFDGSQLTKVKIQGNSNGPIMIPLLQTPILRIDIGQPKESTLANCEVTVVQTGQIWTSVILSSYKNIFGAQSILVPTFSLGKWKYPDNVYVRNPVDKEMYFHSAGFLRPVSHLVYELSGYPRMYTVIDSGFWLLPLGAPMTVVAPTGSYLVINRNLYQNSMINISDVRFVVGTTSRLVGATDVMLSTSDTPMQNNGAFDSNVLGTFTSTSSDGYEKSQEQFLRVSFPSPGKIASITIQCTSTNPDLNGARIILRNGLQHFDTVIQTSQSLYRIPVDPIPLTAINSTTLGFPRQYPTSAKLDLSQLSSSLYVYATFEQCAQRCDYRLGCVGYTVHTELGANCWLILTTSLSFNNTNTKRTTYFAGTALVRTSPPKHVHTKRIYKYEPYFTPLPTDFHVSLASGVTCATTCDHKKHCLGYIRRKDGTSCWLMMYVPMTPIDPSSNLLKVDNSVCAKPCSTTLTGALISPILSLVNLGSAENLPGCGYYFTEFDSSGNCRFKQNIATRAGPLSNDFDTFIAQSPFVNLMKSASSGIGKEVKIITHLGTALAVDGEDEFLLQESDVFVMFFSVKQPERALCVDEENSVELEDVDDEGIGIEKCQWALHERLVTENIASTVQLGNIPNESYIAYQVRSVAGLGDRFLATRNPNQHLLSLQATNFVMMLIDKPILERPYQDPVYFKFDGSKDLDEYTGPSSMCSKMCDTRSKECVGYTVWTQHRGCTLKSEIGTVTSISSPENPTFVVDTFQIPLSSELPWQIENSLFGGDERSELTGMGIHIHIIDSGISVGRGGRGFYDDLLLHHNSSWTDEMNHADIIYDIIRGPSGIVPGVTVHNLKIFYPNGTTSPRSFSRAVSDVIQKSTQNFNLPHASRPTIVSVSALFNNDSNVNCMMQMAYSKNIFLVVGAGNDMKSVENFAPANSGYAFVVGAYDDNLRLHFSNNGTGIDAFAASCFPSKKINGSLCGTSFTAPQAAGVLAKMLDERPEFQTLPPVYAYNAIRAAGERHLLTEIGATTPNLILAGRTQRTSAFTSQRPGAASADFCKGRSIRDVITSSSVTLTGHAIGKAISVSSGIESSKSKLRNVVQDVVNVL